MAVTVSHTLALNTFLTVAQGAAAKAQIKYALVAPCLGERDV